MRRCTSLLLALILLFAAFALAEEPEALLARMTLEEKVGQMMLARCPASNAHTIAAKYGLGGYLMFANAFKKRTPASALERVQTIQSANRIPLLIAVDEEGGTVTRVSRYKAFRAKKFASPQSIYQKSGLTGILADAKEKSELLLSIGVNVNLAPVADVSEKKGSFIYKRTLGEDAQTTAAYIDAVVRQMNACGIGCTLKHFPGYGGNSDTHNGIAVDKRDFSEFEKCDLIPFAAGIRAGAGSVMVSHNIILSIDEEYPASLSPRVHQILREEMGFEGVIITDDLTMDAVSKRYSNAEIGVLAVLAGNDMLCTGAYATQIGAIVDAVREDLIEESRIDESVLRILRWKQSLGLI